MNKRRGASMTNDNLGKGMGAEELEISAIRYSFAHLLCPLISADFWLLSKK
jgi:hypothetical protein